MDGFDYERINEHERAWISSSSPRSANVFHLSKHCHTIRGTPSEIEFGDIMDLDDDEAPRPCKNCTDAEREKPSQYDSYAKKIRSGEVEAADITSELDIPEPGRRW
jgi:hypothetical protein